MDAKGPVDHSQARVGIRRDQVIVLGRYLFVFRPVIDSILDTVFWGDGYKSIAHIVLLLYLSYHQLCGMRFMFLFTAFHFFMKAGKRSECTDEQAVFLFKATIHDMNIVLRRYNPSLRHVWPMWLAVSVVGVFIEVVLQQSIMTWIDASIGPLTVVVILICYGLVDPRYTRNYMNVEEGDDVGVVHSRSSSQGANSGPPSFSKQTPPQANGNIPNSSGAMMITPLVLSPKQEFAASPLSTELPVAASSKIVRCPYSIGETPTAPWDELLPPCPTIPVFMHKVLMLYTRAPNWVDWKLTEDTIGRNHPISWTVVKAGLNVATVHGVTFDEAVDYIDDDRDLTKPVESLHVFQFDKLLGEFRRLYRVDEHTRVVHMVYKQIIFGVAPRDAPMYVMAKELTKDEIDYYGLRRSHANNSDVTDGEGRIFVMSSAPADGVAPVQGHVRCVVHRQAIIIREVPSKSCIQLMTIVCGEPGGHVPARIVDMTRGEQMKIVTGMRKALLEHVKTQKRKRL